MTDNFTSQQITEASGAMRLGEGSRVIDMPDMAPPSTSFNVHHPHHCQAPPPVPPPPPSSPAKQPRNRTLERESQGVSSLLTYSAIFLLFDVWKQVTSYGMKYYNDGRYPMAQTKVVAMTETLKFVVFFGYMACCGHVQQIGLSPWFAVPSVIYAVNNNIYYLALRYTTPPVWNILIQMRIVTTALAYRVIFKRVISRTQWGGIALLIVAILMANFAVGQPVGGVTTTAADWYRGLLITLFLAFLGSITSALASLTMEYLFKNETLSFSEMQLQLYLFGSMCGWVLFGLESVRFETAAVRVDPAHKDVVLGMAVGCVALSCASGIAVAVIVKKLDNIVKLYTQAVSNLLTSLACAAFFPDHFALNPTFLLCLALMLAAVFLYEAKTLAVTGPSLWATVKGFVKERCPPRFFGGRNVKHLRKDNL